MMERIIINAPFVHPSLAAKGIDDYSFQRLLIEMIKSKSFSLYVLYIEININSSDLDFNQTETNQNTYHKK